MGHQYSRFHFFQLIKIIPPRPKLVVVPSHAIVTFGHFLITDVAVAVVTFLRVSTVDEIVKYIDILTHVSTRMPDEAIRSVVMVVGGIGCDRDDGLQPFHSCGRSGKRNRSVIGSARHANLARAPIGFHLLVAIWRLESSRPSIQPVDDRFGSQRLVNPTDGRTTLR